MNIHNTSHGSKLLALLDNKKWLCFNSVLIFILNFDKIPYN